LSTDDAIGFHRELSREREDDPQLLLDLFALAIAHGDVESATEALQTAISVAQDRAVVQADPVPLPDAGIRRPTTDLESLYGALISNLVALPIADKLASKAQLEYVLRTLVIEGTLHIQNKTNPDVMLEFLNAYLPENQRAVAA
jgi:chemotaxis protein MotA